MQKKLRRIFLSVLFVVTAQSLWAIDPQTPLDDVHWPTLLEWEELNQSVEGRLLSQRSPFEHALTPELKEEVQNALALQAYPWGMELCGWQNAWKFEVSPYVLAAETTQDIVQAIQFAQKHQIPLIVKGTGHDYLGRSNGAAGSLLLWTHKMRDVLVHDAFVPQGAPKEAAVPAVTIQAGARWIEVYHEVVVKQGRYVQGGGCTSVGAVGGFLQGGGFGSFSKKYGLAAASLLEAEVVVASGEVLIANAFQNTELFWALKGGGAATFGIVSKATLQTHVLPTYFGHVTGKIIAHSDRAFEQLLEHFIHFYKEQLNNEHWGEQVILKPENRLDVRMMFQDLTQTQAEEVWMSFKNWVETYPELYTLSLHVSTTAAKDFWSYHFWTEHAPKTIVPYEEGKNAMFYWAGDQSQVMAYGYAYQSRWIPLSLFAKEEAAYLAKTLFKATREWEVELHFNKGLAGASEEARQRSKNTSINPVVHEAAALAICSAGHAHVLPGTQDDPQVQSQGSQNIQNVNAAAKILQEATPRSGAYSNEADYFQDNWQEAFWGVNYPRLLEIKKKYDPTGFFHPHHSVGSENPS